jgi:tetratricopeptide (TPR) repeat protein
MEFLTIAATIAGILGFLYVVFVGQKSIPEWFRERKTPKNNLPDQFAVQAIAARVVQHNLPHRGDFIGREKEKQQVHEALRSRSFIVTIDGIGGIGKTSLALEVLHECLATSQNSQTTAPDAQKFDAFIWTSARDRELNINDVLDIIAHTLDHPVLTQLPVEEKRHTLVKRLQEKPCLLIVDNFETVTDDAVRDFVSNLPEPSKCLITSRTQNIRQARAIALRGMEKDEARRLIRCEESRLGIKLDALMEHEKNFQRFYEATGGAPLAIRWSIGQIKQRGQSIESVLNSLYGASGDVFELIFARAWSLLAEASAKILMAMPVFADSASKAAIEAASGIHQWELDEGLGRLVELWLVEASEKLDESKRRYTLHPLTRAFAKKKLAANPNWEREARIQLAVYFENFAGAAGGDRLAWEKYDDLEEEEDNIFALLDWCFENDTHMAGLRLTKAVTFFMIVRGYRHESMKFGEKAIAAARQEKQTADLAWLLVYGLGWREINGGNLERGEALMREGLQIYETLKDDSGVRAALRRLGRALQYKNDFAAARQCYEKGMCLAGACSDKLGMAAFERELALIALEEGKFAEAKDRLEAILPILRERHEFTLASVLGELASAYRGLGELDKAYQFGSEGLELARKMKRRETVSWISLTLAHLEAQRGNDSAALALAQQGWDFFERTELFRDDEAIKRASILIRELQERLATS